MSTDASFFTTLFSIVVIDLVLAGDNAILIALAARDLPAYLRRKTIFWGTMGAVFTRILMTVGIVQLLSVPGLMLAGGIALLWISYKLMTQLDVDKTCDTKATSMSSTLKTIIIADTVMGIDNTLGVAGASNGSITLAIIGLLISIPIMISGSNLVLKIIKNFPIMIFFSTLILVYTAAHMITMEPLISPFIYSAPELIYVIYIVSFFLVFFSNFLGAKKYYEKHRK